MINSQVFFLKIPTLLVICLTVINHDVNGQIDTSSSNMQECYRSETSYWEVGTRLINGQTVNIPQWKLEFFLQHRFGYLNEGRYNLYGLDESNMRLGFDFRLNKKLMTGFSRSNLGKMYSTYVKWAIVKQSASSPVSVSWFSDISITAARKAPGIENYYFTHRLFYTHQLIVSRVFGYQRLMLQIAPTIVHRNYVDSLKDPNDVPIISFGSRLRLNEVISLTAEYNYSMYPFIRKNRTSCFGTGIEFYTGGHVFQLVFTNAAALTENQFMTTNNGKLSKGQIRFGFNIVRRF